MNLSSFTADANSLQASFFYSSSETTLFSYSPSPSSRVLSPFFSISQLPTMEMRPVIANPMIAVFLTLLATFWLKQLMSPCLIAAQLAGLIMCINSRFHTILPTPKATTRAAVTLLFELGNWVHMQFRIGTDPRANIDPGMIIEKITKVSSSNHMRLTRGERKKTSEQKRTTNQNPYLLHTWGAQIKETTIGMTDIRRMRELVWGVMCEPWQWNCDRKYRLIFPQQVVTEVLNFIMRAPTRAFKVAGLILNFSKSLAIINIQASLAPMAIPIQMVNINMQSSNNQYLTKGMSADANKLVKGYESKIILISNELQQARNEREELAEEHERVKKLLIDISNELRLKQKELVQKQKTCLRLQAQKQDLEAVLSKSQRHRRVLYDHLFSDNCAPGHVLPSAVHRNDLIMQLSTISNEFNHSSFLQLQRIIGERNSEVKNISTKYNDLMRQHLKSTYQYQEKIRKLKERTTILQKAKALQLEAEKMLEQKMPKKQHQLTLLNKSLEERVAVMVEKIKLDEEIIRKLNKEVKQKSESLTRCPSPILNDANPEVENYFSVIKQNNQLKKQLKELSDKNEALAQKFPNLVQSEEELVSMMQKYRQVHELELKIKTQMAKISALEHELQKSKQDCSAYAKNLVESRAHFEHNERCFKQIVVRLRNFFILVNPHYESYNFEQLNLTAEEEQLFKKANSEQASLKAEVIDCKQKISRLSNAAQSKAIEFKKLQDCLEDQNRKIDQLKSINQALQKGLKEKSSANLNQTDIKYLSSILKIFNKLQQERNSLALQARNEAIKNVNLTFELSRLMGQQASSVQSLPEKPVKHYPQTNVARPSIVYLQFSKDVLGVKAKLLELEEKIEQNYKNHEFQVGQLKAEHQSIVNNLREKIIKLEVEKQELAGRATSPKLASGVQQQNPEHINQSLMQSLHEQSIVDIEDQIYAEEGIDQPLNTLSAQSIEEMGKLLRGHQVNTKNIIEAYADLKCRLQRLEATKSESHDTAEVQAMKTMIAEYANQIAILKARIREADRNLLVLEESLASKNTEMENLRLSAGKQTENLKKWVESLQQQVEQLRKQDWLQSSPLHRSTSKKYFPEEMEYLLELVMQLKEMQRWSNRKEEGRESRLEGVSKDSEEWEVAEQGQMKQVIESGRLVSALQQAIKSLSEGSG